MKKVLVVDDELAYVKLLSEKLSEKYKVFSAANGEKGLEICKKEHPDLILLDINMPVMDGMTMLSELRKDDYGKTVSVIFLTNLEPSLDIVQNVVKDQPTLFVVKSDTSLQDLIKKVDSMLA